MTFYTGHETLYDYLVQDIPDGDHTFQTVANGVSEDLQIEFVNIRGDTIYDGDNPVLGNEVNGERTLVLKYWGNLQINHGVLFTPQVPKRGMVVFVMGNLLNRGTISMTAKSTNAVGQDVMLWKNSDGTFEYVPGEVNNGAPRQTHAARGGGKPGLPGGIAIGRSCGGGGTGSIFSGADSSSTQIAGRGGNSSSWGGGGGSGGNRTNGSTTADAIRTAGSNQTGPVGVSSGGSGNPIGANGGQFGTGGLLIVYVDRSFVNDFNAVIEANGTDGGITTNSASNYVNGGASGGGSINIFHRGSFVNNGAITAKGGKGTKTAASIYTSGSGGDGSVTTMQITFLQNRIRFYNDQHKPITAMDMGFAIQGAYSPISKFRAESMYLIPIKDLEIGWKVAPDSPSNEAILEFSKTENPFTPENPITFPGLVLNYREGVEMFVRAKSGEMQVDQTKFAITAKIEGA